MGGRLMSGWAASTVDSRFGLSFLIWNKDRMTADLGLDQLLENGEEDGGEVLNWTAKLEQSTVRTALSLSFGFPLSHTQVIEMGTFVPDELISNLLTCRRYTTFTGAVLFADVSGFTPLCETYSKFGSSGAYRLTATLNRYIGAMVNLIHTFGGDLLKFSGDAFLASWHVRINEYIYHKIHDAISCAMHIQYSLGNFVTDVGLSLKVKLAIAAGNFTFCIIGNESSGATYMILGLPIMEVKKAESLCKSGDTVLAKSAWSFLIPQNYNYQDLGRGYVRIKQILYDPKSSKRKIFDFNKHYLDHEKNRKNSKLGFENHYRSEFFAKSVKKVSSSLRPFIISPVLQQIEASQSLDYLVEMRRVTIMFINLIPNTARCKAILTLVDETYRSILRSVQNKLGLVNKVNLFDKDIMFLVVFGLKGYKDKDEASRALRSAYEIHKNVSQFPDVQSISIGITMGTTYCGVVGHPLRKEFTVIGAPVNKAARLMCAFKGMVSCDASVAFSSRLPKACFEKMEPVNLKGIVGQVADIFKYDEVGFNTLTDAPIIRRHNIIRKFDDMLYNRSLYKAMVIIGEPRVGKSRVLIDLADNSKTAQWGTSMTPLHKKSVSHFCFIQKVIATILGSSSRERMAKLIKTCRDDDDMHSLYKLNSYFDTKFSRPYSFKSEKTTEFNLKKLYIKTLQKISLQDVILIDDAEGLDGESWKILNELTIVPGILVVISLPSALETIESSVRKYLKNPLIIMVKLENLPRKYVAPLVCQMLTVDAAPRKLIRNLYKISRGIPGWVQAFLLSYVETGAITVVSDVPESVIYRKSYYVVTPSNLYKATGQKSKIGSVVNVEKLKICKLVNKDLKKDGIPPTFDDVIMATFDNLTPFKQLMLKCGAILGKEFKRSELEAVMDWHLTLALALGVKSLFEIDILCCASKYNPMEHLRRSSSEASPITFKPVLNCYCENKPKGKFGKLPKYALCMFMSFRFDLLRSTIYEVIPMNQRAEFHMRAFNYVRTQIMKCPICIDYELSISLKKFRTYNEHSSASISIAEQQSDAKSEKKPGVSFLIGEPSHADNRRGGVLGAFKGVTFNDDLSENEEDGLDLEDTLISDRYDYMPTAAETYMSRNASVAMIGGEDRKIDESQRKIIQDLPLYMPHVVDCTCNQVATVFYKKLLYHAKAADAKVEKLKVLVEFGIHCVKYSNIVKAYGLFKEALELCEEILGNFSAFENTGKEDKAGTDSKKKKKKLSPSKVLFEKAKAKCYFGMCCSFLGYIRQGMSELTSVASTGTMAVVKYYLHITSFKLKSFSEVLKKKEKHKLGLMSFAFSCIAQNNILQNKLMEAEQSAGVALKYAKLVNTLDYLSNAYSTYIEVCLLLGKYKQSKKAEKEALAMCLSLFREKDFWDVLYLGRIFTAVFKGRLFRGELQRTDDLAKAILRTSATFKAYDVEILIYPLLFRSLANKKKLHEAADLLQNIKNKKNSCSHFDAIRMQNLYYMLNLIMLIEIGYSMEHPQDLIKHYELKFFSPTSSPKYFSHHKISRRKIIYMWLWFLRRQEFDKAELWQVEPHDGHDLLLENIPTSVLLLEGWLLWLVHCINKYGVIHPDIQKDIELRIDILEQMIRKKMLILLPQILHMKAYKNVICFDYDGKIKELIPGLAELREALKISKEHSSINRVAWIHQSMIEWYVEPQQFLEEETRHEHLDSNIALISLGEDKELYQYQTEDALYHLPLPQIIAAKLIEYLANCSEMNCLKNEKGSCSGLLIYGLL